MIQYIADAFTDKLFAGNPAAVLPCREMPAPELMQSIAIENNYSETAFVVRRAPGDYELKWFTPGGEVALCGHATLATSFVLHRYIDPDAQELHFHTLSGELIVRPGADGGYDGLPGRGVQARPGHGRDPRSDQRTGPGGLV